jgi:hypothetical protein
MGDVGSCQDNAIINTSVVDSASTEPNLLTTWHPQCPGGLGNVAPSNVFASAQNGIPVAALWDDDDVIGSGRLAILMDVNWAQTTYADMSTMPGVTQNLAQFLSA